MAHASHHDIIPPKELKVPKIIYKLGIIFFVIGLVAFIASVFFNAPRAWRGYLIGYWFVLSLGLAGPFLVATQYLSRAGWSVSIRRIPEALGAFLYPAIPLGLIMLLGAGKMFKWLKPEAQNDAIIAEKFGFLHFPGLVMATAGATVLWALFYTIIRRNSVKQDSVGGYALTNRNMWMSAGFIFVFVIGFSFMSWYWVMSFDAHWYSTMFSVYTFAGLFQSGLALISLILIYLVKQGTFGSFAGINQIHDMGKFVFAFTVFYAYIAFSQFLLIWYAGIPEAALWYMHRIEHGWLAHTLLIPVLKFLVPFFLLLPQDHKKNKNGILQAMCWLILAVQLYEVWYWVMPYPAVDGYGPNLPIYELPIALGFIGIFMLVVAKAISSVSIVPVKDPYLHESLPHH